MADHKWTDHKWKAGQAALIDGHKRVTIDKVSNTGRVTVGSQVFNADGRLRGGSPTPWRWTPKIEPLTPEVEAALAKAERTTRAYNDLAKTLDAAEKWARHNFSANSYNNHRSAADADVEKAERMIAFLTETIG